MKITHNNTTLLLPQYASNSKVAQTPLNLFANKGEVYGLGLRNPNYPNDCEIKIINREEPIHKKLVNQIITF